MKIIEVDDELYQFIAAKTERIGEEASDILRRLLGFAPLPGKDVITGADDGRGNTIKARDNTTKAKDNTAAKTAMPLSPKVTVTELSLPGGSATLAALTLDRLDKQKGVVGRFLYILSQLQQCHLQGFDHITAIRGRDRLYFAKDQQALSLSGSSTNPKQIGNSGYWVLTNSNTVRKKWMLCEAAKMLGYAEDDAIALGDMLEREDEAKAKLIKKEQAKKARLKKAQKKGATVADKIQDEEA